MSVSDHLSSSQSQPNLAIEQIGELEQQEQQRQNISNDCSSGVDVVEITLDIVDVLADLVSGIDLSL